MGLGYGIAARWGISFFLSLLPPRCHPRLSVAESGDLRGLCGSRSRIGFAVRDDSVFCEAPTLIAPRGKTSGGLAFALVKTLWCRPCLPQRPASTNRPTTLLKRFGGPQGSPKESQRWCPPYPSTNSRISTVPPASKVGLPAKAARAASKLSAWILI